MNPMEHAELSKIALSTGADYSWNTSKYDYQESWKKSIEMIYGDLAPYMITFADSTHQEWKQAGLLLVEEMHQR